MRCFCALLFLVPWLLLPQPPRPPQPGPPDERQVTEHIASIRQKLNKTPAVSVSAHRALEYSRSYLHRAETSLAAHRLFVADRLSATADALLHVAEHQEHLRTNGGPHGPPPPEEIRKHLERVYFQLQNADYFLSESRDRAAKPFPQWARGFYQVAVKAAESHDTEAADENAKCAEEVVRALENLAQAAADDPASFPKPPPAPPPPPPPPGGLL